MLLVCDAFTNLPSSSNILLSSSFVLVQQDYVCFRDILGLTGCGVNMTRGDVRTAS
jgi:hypothetical protein